MSSESCYRRGVGGGRRCCGSTAVAVGGKLGRESMAWLRNLMTRVAVVGGVVRLETGRTVVSCSYRSTGVSCAKWREREIVDEEEKKKK